MELNPRYKQTEVGANPADWKSVRLAHISAFITKGATPTTYGFKWEQSGVLFLRSECVSEAGLDLDQSMFISSEAHATLRRSEVRDGDILVTITGNVGRVVRLMGIGIANVNQHIARIRITDPDSDAGYIYQYLSQPSIRQRFNKIVTGQAYPQISLKQVREAEVLRPSLRRQRAIAAALSDVDALLARLDQFITKKQNLKQATIQQLFTGQIRLPGFSETWDLKRLAAVAEIRSGGTPSTSQSEFWDGDIPWCTPTDITALSGRKYLTHTSRSITKQGLKYSAAELIPVGSVVMTSRATIGECAINAIPVATNQGFKNFIPFSMIDSGFLYYLLQTQRERFISLCGGSTFLEIGKKQLADFEVSLPKSRDEQVAIASILSDMDAELAVLEARRDKTLALKQGMMQELLTGRTRLV